MPGSGGAGTSGKIVAVVGNTGVGKTTLVGRLQARFSLLAGMEQHEERPFQRLFASDHRRFALANQVDYLLYRAEQEREIRKSGRTGIQDGGLDMDFRVFTRLFLDRGYLDAAEYAVCERLYCILRGVLPPPELIVWLRAPMGTVVERLGDRRRPLGIATADDVPDLERYLEGWLTESSGGDVVTIDAGAEEISYIRAIDMLLPRLSALGLREPVDPGT